MVASFSSKFSSSKFSKRTEIQSKGTIIHSIARYAIAHDKVLEASDVAFRVDPRGNVVMIEPENQTLCQGEETEGFNEEKFIVVPRQEAYERIAYATRKKVEQLRGLYELAQRQNWRWSRCSWVMAILAIVGMLLVAIAAVILDISQSHPDWFLLLISMNIGSMVVMGYLWWRVRQSSRQANLYLDNFLEIENFSEMINVVSELPVKDTARWLLQEIIIVQSLGLHRGDIEMPDEDALSCSSNR